jgi:hypothetical protein
LALTCLATYASRCFEEFYSCSQLRTGRDSRLPCHASPRYPSTTLPVHAPCKCTSHPVCNTPAAGQLLISHLPFHPAHHLANLQTSSSALTLPVQRSLSQSAPANQIPSCCRRFALPLLLFSYSPH